MKTIWPLAAVALALIAGPAAAENWHRFAASRTTAYLADTDSIGPTGDEIGIRVAKVATSGAAGDRSHSVDQFVFRCAAGQVRSILSIEYGTDGTESDRFDDSEAPWDDVVENSYLDTLRRLTCDGTPARENNWPSIIAFIDGGRS